MKNLRKISGLFVIISALTVIGLFIGIITYLYLQIGNIESLMPEFIGLSPLIIGFLLAIIMTIILELKKDLEQLNKSIFWNTKR